MPRATSQPARSVGQGAEASGHGTCEPAHCSTRVTAALLLAWAACTGAWMGACVTEVERSPSRGMRLGTQQMSESQALAAQAKANQAKNEKGNAGQAPAAPGVPSAPGEPTGAAQANATSEAQSAGASRTASRVSVAVLPMGEVEYDGFALPVVHPRGEFVAVHVGDAPDWPMVLGEDAEVPTGGRIVRWQRGERGLLRMPAAADDPSAGLLLGRDATEQGVLVEGVEGAGTRRIGLLAWTDGSVRWLTPAGQRWGHGAIVRKGNADLLVCVHWREDGASVLTLREFAGEGNVLAQAQFAREKLSFPTPFPDGSGVLVFASGERGVSVRAVPLSAQNFGEPAWGRVLASVPRGMDAASQADREFARFAAYQAIAGVQAGAFAGTLPGAVPTGVIVLAHPGKGRLWRVSMDDGDGVLLPSDAIAAAWWGGQASAGSAASASGWFITRKDDLAFVPDREAGEAWAVPARVIAQSFVPRVVQPLGQFPQRLLAFGPKRSDGGRGTGAALVAVELAPASVP